MSAPNHTNDDNALVRPAVAAAARPLMLVRARPGTVAESIRVVHLAPLPRGGRGVVTALCGALIRPEHCEAVPPGQGAPCRACLASHVCGRDQSETPDTGSPAELPAPEFAGPGASVRVAALGYRRWGWPVMLRGDQLWLALDMDAVAVLMPRVLAEQVTAWLVQRRSAPPVLDHPYTPQHRVLLAGERYGIAFAWPAEVHRISGTVLLPPTVPPRGPLTWAHPPGPTTLKGCREIDIMAALRARRDPPPASGPMHY